jgi:hypothetical protein
MLKHTLTICTLVALPFAAAAQTTTGTTTTTTSTTTSTPTTSTTTTTTANTTVSMDKLVDKYTTLAGSKENAKKLVTGLREGGDIKIGSETIKTPTDKMGVGNVNIALALTQAKLDQDGIEKPTTKQLNGALTDILKMRADGMGWGQIAQKMDMKLGDVMGNRPDRVAKVEKHGKPERAEKFERPEKPVRFEKPERPERPGK